jgi:hypothetical protein
MSTDTPKWTAISITGDDGTKLTYRLDGSERVITDSATASSVDPPKPLPFPVEIRKPCGRCNSNNVTLWQRMHGSIEFYVCLNCGNRWKIKKPDARDSVRRVRKPDD